MLGTNFSTGLYGVNKVMDGMNRSEVKNERSQPYAKVCSSYVVILLNSIHKRPALHCNYIGQRDVQLTVAAFPGSYHQVSILYWHHCLRLVVEALYVCVGVNERWMI